MKRLFFVGLVVGLVALVWFGALARSGGQGDSPCRQLPWYFSADANRDNQLDISDPVYLLNYLFLGSPAPRCIAEESTFCDPCKSVFVSQGELNSIHPPMLDPGFYSGLDADKLDGRNAEDFAPADHSHPFDSAAIPDQSIPLSKLSEPAATLTDVDALKEALKNEIDRLRNEIPLGVVTK